MRTLRLILIAGTLFALAVSVTLLVLVRQSEKGQGAPLIGGPFTLTTAENKRVSDSDFRGRLMLVFFGFTNCPDVCPAELTTISKALDLLGPNASKISPLFITVDPERDTPETLKGYLDNVDKRIVGLTGSPSDVLTAAKAYRVYYRKAETQTKELEYTMDHSAFTYLMDQKGTYITHFTFNTSADKMADVIKKHLP